MFFFFENESELDKDETEYETDQEPQINEPYDPLKVDIISQTLSMQSILDRLENREIDLTPEFQRKENLWKPREQSRLIESILIRVPLPAFYFDCRNDDCWTIVDGLQRISTLNNFVTRKTGDELKLRLTDLEYLREYNGLSYEELPRQMQRRIRECQIFAYCIRPGTPDDITISIFKRINTGGMPLTLPEIRNAVYHGKASDLVKEMAYSDDFKLATRGKISPVRMQDRDLVTRFLSFFILGYNSYNGDLNGFLDKGLETVKTKFSIEKCQILLNIFINSMKVCRELFGDFAFRKLIKNNNTFGPLNKSLFECTSVCVANLDENEQKILIEHKEQVFLDYKQLFSTSFFDAINSATGTVEHVVERYTKLIAFFEKQVRKFS
ncbi:DUF262 domain-containing protein [Treponema ruminis]|uniref:GmrSD restriction endonucleases N-terminal domain-containing protein n=1 Tax=Treponema ruminis TaxID=744515 RepID=A0A7W8LMI4_9SPIR|nr:DUF262 domain-containing protein [Treponema ruminis]MBB5226576.1 hypothetical protein [Treponema ruminis]QSI02194.1 DUF262 domain-containing protein [Treponema ruminis]